MKSLRVLRALRGEKEQKRSFSGVNREKGKGGKWE
jgi:hypothetical protein